MKCSSVEDTALLKSCNKSTVAFKVDIIASIISEGCMKILATMEYKPDNSKEDVRIAQRDMYATHAAPVHWHRYCRRKCRSTLEGDCHGVL